ncbi:MAG: aspartate/tyrosine/aromatic aminotransferase [Candidatus Pelagadaptatus aseana]|uniref:amino acid aminotransferase n=1 Tax=Candidatus Pelagadaptatus aseana TaxID=3120508 RepID=UPI0039B1957C
MFETLQALPADPILGLSVAYREDPNPDKVDLGVGVYKTEQGQTPVLSSVIAAQNRLVATEQTKAYQGPVGSEGFNVALQQLILSDDPALQQRAATLQSPGGCGALRLGAELIREINPQATIWVSTPTWANHIPLLGSAGLKLQEYPYYDPASQSVNFDAMVEVLKTVPAGDVVLLHGCCHNPCGTDLTLEQWQQLADMARQQGFTPFVDLAYQGFGDGIEEDAAGLRLLAKQLPEMLIASSCSKNFGLYRERTGAITVVSATAEASNNARSHLMKVARGIYSMPPAHGALLVEEILTGDLKQQWQQDVAEMRERIHSLRLLLANALADAGDFSFIPQQKGMFSFLGLSPEQVGRLKTEHSVYMVDSSRINIAGVNSGNIDYLAEAIRKVL